LFVKDFFLKFLKEAQKYLIKGDFETITDQERPGAVRACRQALGC
jgi:hypothetical protein